MILSPAQIVWAPIIGRTSVAIALTPAFAEACLNYTLNEQVERRVTQCAWENMGNRGPIIPSNFFHFGGNLLLRGVYYRSDGVWLTLDAASLSSTLSTVMYYGHNEDHYAGDRLGLLQAFGEWAKAAQVLLEWE